MSVEIKLVSNTEVVPVASRTGVFDGNDQRFAMVHLGVGMPAYEPGQDTPSELYGKLRANVYINQMAFLENSERQTDGTEWNTDDERSSHYVVLEKRLGGEALFACARLIEKQTDEPLPIEEFFPDIFQDSPASLGSVEVSRFIARHERAIYNLDATARLLAAMANDVNEHHLGPVHAIVEPHFERTLAHRGLVVERISEPRWIPEYKSINRAIRINVEESATNFGEALMQDMKISTARAAFWGTQPDVEQIA